MHPQWRSTWSLRRVNPVLCYDHALSCWRCKKLEWPDNLIKIVAVISCDWTTFQWLAILVHEHVALLSLACALLYASIQNRAVVMTRGFPDFRHQIASRWLLSVCNNVLGFPKLINFLQTTQFTLNILILQCYETSRGDNNCLIDFLNNAMNPSIVKCQLMVMIHKPVASPQLCKL